MPSKRITHDRLREVLRYCPDSGNFFWRTSARGRRMDKPAGRLSAGYTQIQVDNCFYQAHWLAWFYVYKTWPIEEIDHINGGKRDNRISNLRLATRSENRQNHAQMSNNTSGYRGVCWSKKERKWIASICVDNVQRRLGTFTDPEEAYKVYLAAKHKLHTFQPTPRSTITQQTEPCCVC